MAKKKLEAAPPPPDAEDPAAEGLDGVEFEPTGESGIDLAAAEGKSPVGEGAAGPSMHDPGWTPWVMAQLTDDELADGRPKVAGLRRLAMKLLGPVLENTTEVVQAPSPGNGMVATVKATVVILWDSRDMADNQAAHPRTFSGVADVYKGNTDEKFARHPCSTAETKAEGRAFKKALALVGVTAAEEVARFPVEDSRGDGLISDAQRNILELKCRQLDIDIMAFVNIGRTKFPKLANVTYDAAEFLIGRVNEYQQKKTPIPDALVGYDPDWEQKQ